MTYISDERIGQLGAMAALRLIEKGIVSYDRVEQAFIEREREQALDFIGDMLAKNDLNKEESKKLNNKKED